MREEGTRNGRAGCAVSATRGIGGPSRFWIAIVAIRVAPTGDASGGARFGRLCMARHYRIARSQGWWCVSKRGKIQKSATLVKPASEVGHSPTPPEKKKPLKGQGLRYGAGEEGRTPDLMLGKHTL
jgi:hypothetical protein